MSAATMTQHAASASIKNEALARCRELVSSTPKADPQGLPGKTWAAMPIKTRTVLVMLGSTCKEDPRDVARRPWQSLGQSDRESIGACARQLGRDLIGAAGLF
jgi:hypothetical protein